MGNEPFITFDDISLRMRTRRILEGTSWEMKCNQHWAILGPNGAGKSTFVKSIFGKVPVVKGKITYHFAESNGHQSPRKFQYISYVSPESVRDIMADEKLQDEIRDFSGKVDQVTTVADIIIGDLDHTTDTDGLAIRLQKVARQVKVRHLLGRGIRSLSTGEMSHVLIARSLMTDPKLLILDEPFDGLDKISQKSLAQTIKDLMQGDMRVLLITHKFEEIVDGITHVLYLKDGRVHTSGKKESVLNLETIKDVFGFNQTKLDVDNRKLSLPSDFGPDRSVTGHANGYKDNDYPLVKMKNVTVRYAGIVTLDAFNWTMNRGENWVLLGPAGAGKSTILKLILGENLQAYANEIHLFGKKKGSGVSIWDIKKNIGIVSSDLQAGYALNIRAFDVVCSGFHDTVGLYKKCSPEQIEIARNWFGVMGVANLKNKSFGGLSHGQRQLILIARAMVKSPLLLMIDEPCDGLDIFNRMKLYEIIEHVGRHTQTNLIYATHNEQEILPCMTDILRLDHGKLLNVQKNEISHFAPEHLPHFPIRSSVSSRV